MMGRFSVIFAGTLAMVAGLGCTFQPKREAPGGATGGGTGFLPDANVVDDTAVFRPDAAIEYISVDVENETGPTSDANCGNVPFTVVIPPPELLIVLDRSGSMNEDSMGVMQPAGSANTKWALMTAAINEAMLMSETKVNWGLKFFGTGMGNNQGCTVSNVVAVPPATMNAAAIAAAIALPANQPGTSTPTRAAAMTSGAYMVGRQATNMNPKYILLATDGEPNCAAGGGNGSDAVAAVQAVADVATMGIPTFVIGIAADGVAGTTLDQMAVAGGKPRAGTPMYYSVTTTADLVTALNAIQSSVVGMCTYPLGPETMTQDRSVINISVDGTPTPKDTPDGWVLDPGGTSITFTGATCAQLMTGTLKSVQILFGCKVGPVEYRPDESAR